MDFVSRVTIGQPPETVWAILMDSGSWARWWGGVLLRVNPRWTVGAELEWEGGAPDEVLMLVPPSRLEIGGKGRSTADFRLEPAEPGATVVTYCLDFSGSHLSVTEPSVVQARCDATMARLKRFAEAKGKRYATRAGWRKSWQFWRRGAHDIASGPDDATQGLLADLKDEVAGVRTAAAEALGRSGGAGAVGPLIEAMGDPEECVRRAAADALDELGWQPDEDETKATYYVAKQRWRDCAALGAPGVRVLVGLHTLQRGRWTDDPVGQALDALAEAGEVAVEPLIIALGDDSRWTRVYAADVLLRIGDPRAVEPLIAALDDKEEYMRKCAVEVLGEFGDSRAVEPLLGSLRDELVGNAAAIALGKLGDPRAVEPLIGALKDEDVGSQAARVLGKTGDARAFAALVAALRDGSGFFLLAVIEALGELGDPRAVEPLNGVLRDGDALERKYAADALAAMGK